MRARSFSLFLFFLICTCVLSSCSTRKTSSGKDLIRLFVAQQGKQEVVIIDLVSGDPSFETITVRAQIQAFNSLRTDMHPLGNIGYVDTYNGHFRFDLNNRRIISSQPPLTSRAPMDFSASGLLYAHAKVGSDTVSVYQGFSGEQLSSLQLPNFAIHNVALCDNNKTLLLVGRDNQTSQNVVTKLDLGQRFNIINPIHHLNLPQDLNRYMLVDCSPGSDFGTVLIYGSPSPNGNTIKTFSVTSSGLTEIQSQTAVVNGKPNKRLPGTGVSQSIGYAPDGESFYVRFSTMGNAFKQGWIEKFDIDASTGRLTADASFFAPAPHTIDTLDPARITFSPDSRALYFPDTENDAIYVIDTATGLSRLIEDTFNKVGFSKPEFVSAAFVKCADLQRDGCEDKD